MESQTVGTLSPQEVIQLITDGLLCPYPRGYKPHDYNAGAIEDVAAMSPEQRREWLWQARQKRLALQAKAP